MNDIRAMIRERGLKQENVARALQISTNTLNKKLNGETEFRLCEAKTLAALLDTSVDALFFGDLGDQKEDTINAITERLKRQHRTRCGWSGFLQAALSRHEGGSKMKLTPEQVEALDVGTVVGRLADLKNLLFIMDSWMNSRGKVDELNREADCSKYDLEALWHELPMYYTLLWSIIEAIDKSQAELLDTAKTLDALNILKGY